MKYMGSKNRISKYIVPILQESINTTGFDYFEPFCGGCNIIDKIVANNRYANDNNKYLIAMWNHLIKHQHETYPDDITYDVYSSIRENKSDYPDWFVGFVGFLASYNGRFFDGGYAKKSTTPNGTERNYYKEALNNISKQLSSLNGVFFTCNDYRKFNPTNMVIYCDPPYKNTKQYTTSKNFDHDEFWNLMRLWSLKNIVFISEQSAPLDFTVIWQQEITRTNNREPKKAIEKLFQIERSDKIGFTNTDFENQGRLV